MIDRKPTTEYLDVMYAWLDPEGNFYKVEYHEHKTFAALICKRPEYELEESGWCALRGGNWDTFFRRGGCEFTQAQYDTLYHWFTVNDGRTNEIVFPAGTKRTISMSYFRAFKVEGT
jgi:hypothetical protein